MALFQYTLPLEAKSNFLSPEEVLLSLSETLLKTGDTKKALQEVLVQGVGIKLKGLAELLNEVRRLKASLLEKYNPRTALEALQKENDETFSGPYQFNRNGTFGKAERKGGTRVLDLTQEKNRLEKKHSKSIADLSLMLKELIDRFPFTGSQPLDPEKASDLIEQLDLIYRIEKALQRIIWGYDLNAINGREIENLLGKEARLAWETLKSIKPELEKTGLLEKSRGTYRLTRKGFEIISSKLLKEIFDLMKRDLVGKHESKFRGEGSIDTSTSYPYKFGSPFHINLSRTLMNAIIRQGYSIPLSLKPEDFEVYDPEYSTRCATVLMLDMSKSMKDRNNFLTAKKVALALNDLIRRKFPRDFLEIVGFSTIARKLLPEELPYLLWDADQPYTNIQDGLRLSLKILQRKGYQNKQIILITDGEPTAHSEGGKLYFQFPPHPRTIEKTLEAVKQCTRQGIVITTFMMVKSNPLTNFVQELTKINPGRAYYSDTNNLGKLIIINYLTSTGIKRRKP